MSILSKKKTFSELFPVPEYLLLSNTGLVITDTEIKLVEFKRGEVSNNFQITHFEKLRLPDGIVQSGFISAPEKLIEILTELSHRLKFRYVYATLPEERAYLFTTLIEKVPAESLYDAIAFIIEENVPVKLANSVFDFDIIEELNDTNQLKVTVSVISKKVVDFYLQIFQSAGITPVSFDIESQAIARAIIEKGDKRTQLIVNFGEKKTGFYVVEDEVVQFTTTLPYGVTADGRSTHVANLKAELRKVLAFWVTRAEKPGFSESKIERIIFCGSAARNDSFLTEVKNECESECAIADLWVNAPEAGNNLPKSLDRESLDSASIVGLCLPSKNKTYV